MTILPYRAPQTPSAGRRHSPAGVAAFAMAVAELSLLAATYAGYGGVGFLKNVGHVLAILAFAVSPIGLGLAVDGLFDRRRRRLFAALAMLVHLPAVVVVFWAVWGGMR